MTAPSDARREVDDAPVPVSPVLGAPTVVEMVDLAVTPWRSETRMVISPDEPVFAGHYPDFPIFPGVCVVECAHRSALATAAPQWGRLDLVEVSAARFSGAVFPGDELRFELDWRSDDGLLCRVIVTGDRGRATTTTLRYRSEVPA